MSQVLPFQFAQFLKILSMHGIMNMMNGQKLHGNAEVTNPHNNHLNAKLINIVYYTFFMKLKFSQINLFNKMTL
jgi:hypothetical protein